MFYKKLAVCFIFLCVIVTLWKLFWGLNISSLRIYYAEIWVNGNTDVYFVLFYVILKSMLFYIYPEVNILTNFWLTEYVNNSCTSVLIKIIKYYENTKYALNKGKKKSTQTDYWHRMWMHCQISDHTIEISPYI